MKYDVIMTTVDARCHRVDQSRNEIGRTARGEQELDWTPSGEEMITINEVDCHGFQRPMHAQTFQ